MQEASSIPTSPTFSTVGRLAVGTVRSCGRQIKKLGYTGSDALFRLFITSVRKHHQVAGTSAELSLDADGVKVSSPVVDPASQPCLKRRLSPARASWLYISQEAKLDTKQQQQVDQVR